MNVMAIHSVMARLRNQEMDPKKKSFTGLLHQNHRELEEQATMWKSNVSLEPLWEKLINCIGVTEAQLAQSSLRPTVSNVNVGEHVQGTSSSSPALSAQAHVYITS